MYFAHQDDTIVALSTPPGVGAIAVIRMSGSKVMEIGDAIFRGKKLNKQLSHTIHFGNIEDAGNKIDEVLLSLFKKPDTYTGEDVIEISCHGSPFIQQQIINLIIQKGARLAKPGEFTLRAFLNGKMDLSQAEAVADLIAAQTASAKDMAIKQMRGGYSQIIKELRNQLIQFAALIELELDFGEEDVEFAERENLLKLIEKIQAVISGLIASFELGNVIKQGVTTVIAGRPNAGKSTLLNTLLNEERAIVSEIAGTTRDTIEEELNINGIIFRLIDTAGLHHATDAIEKKGVERTYQKIKQSALLLYVFDVSAITVEDIKKDLQNFSEGDFKIILAGNKIDLDKNAREKFAGMNNLIFISSSQKINIDELKNAMYKKIIHGNINREDAIVSNIRHVEALRKTTHALGEVKEGIANKLSGELVVLDIRRALNYLGDITGEISNEDLLDSIFRNFCIGK